MAPAPRSTGTSGTTIRSCAKAFDSSHSPSTIATTTTARKAGFHTYSDSRMTAPSATATARAAGRLRPARLRRSGGATTSIGTGSSGEVVAAPSPVGCCAAGSVFGSASTVVSSSDLEQLGFLVPEQLVDRADVLVGDLFELLLTAPRLVLADLAVLDQAVEPVLGVPADVADRDLGVLRLLPGDLDE